MRHRVTVEQKIALADEVTFLNGKVLALRDHVFRWIGTFFLRTDHHAALAL